MKDRIKEALKEIVPDVYYGSGRFQGRKSWDCIVFGKRRTRKTNSGSGNTRRWFVAIVKEEYIPEELEKQVIKKMKDIGFKEAENTDTLYDYVEKAGECTVEICTMEFYKIEKRCSR